MADRFRATLTKGERGGHMIELPLDVRAEEAKREETRARRLTKSVEMLRDGVKTPR